MFFAPPEVRAISRYSDFGTHLGVRAFGVTVLLAVLLHASIIGIVAMMPHPQVVKIPVRVLNFNLGTVNEAPPSEQPMQPAPSPASAAPKVTSEEAPAAKTPQHELEKALNTTPEPVKKAPAIHAAVQKPKESPKDSVAEKTAPAAAKPLAINMPKRYVRESPLDITKKAGNAAAAPAPGKPEEIVQRYEQAISIWFSQHKVYPEEAKRRRIEGDAVVRVRINRQGRILYYVIDKSSGDAFIDHAVMAMVRSSDPAPAVPENYPEGDEFEFLVPVSFTLEK